MYLYVSSLLDLEPILVVGTAQLKYLQIVYRLGSPAADYRKASDPQTRFLPNICRVNPPAGGQKEPVLLGRAWIIPFTFSTFQLPNSNNKP